MTQVVLFVIAELWLAVSLVDGLKTSVVEYADSSCAPPALSVSFTSALTCTPQVDHSKPTCVKGAGAYSVSDCTSYNQGGGDDFNIVNDVFDGYPYLGVEKYVAGRCGRYDSVTSATIYRLDENCYPNAAGTESHRLTLGHSAVITMFSDTMCTNVKSTTSVRQAAMGLGPYGLCIDEVTGFYGGPRPNLTAIAIYEDNTCSRSPLQLRFSQDFVCLDTTEAPCQPHPNSHFSTVGCTNDFLGYSASVFGAANPYVTVEDFANPWCSNVENVTVYAADGACHTSADGSTSFRATVSIADSTATVTTYLDPDCNLVASDTSLDGQTLSSSPCVYVPCDIWFGCGRRYHVGGLGGPPSMGKKTAVVQYGDSSCTAPALSVSFTSALTCTPQEDHFNPTCVNEGAGYTVLDCTYYNQGGWDDFSIAANAFEGYPYLGVEKYVAGRCGRYDSVTSATLYRLDENCYTDPTGSHRLSLGHSAVITTYSDATCTNVKATTTVRQAAMGLGPYGLCIDEVTGFYGGSRPNLTAVAIYGDGTCSGTPTQLRLSQDFACLGTADAPCQIYDNSRFSTAGCTNDFLAYSAAVFGADTPYVIVEDFPSPWCGSVENVTVYLADSACHTSADGATSFRAAINVADSTATLTMYSDTSCESVASDTSLDGQTLSASPCLYVACDIWFGCGRRYAVGGLGAPPSMGKKSAVVQYGNSSCSTPATLVKFTSALTCTPQADHFNPTCVNNGAGCSVSDCTDYNQGGWDSFTIANGAFDGYPYLGVEKYVAGRCGRYDSVTSATLYRLDENCYPNAAGTESHRLTLGHSAVITTFSDTMCTNVKSTTSVRQAAMGLGPYGLCLDEVTGFYGGSRPNLTVLALYQDACSGTPAQLRFSQDFVCLGTADPSCQPHPNSHFSTVGCTNDFLGYSATVFGADRPYLIVQDFPNPWCSSAENVTVYLADGECHPSADGAARTYRATVNTADNTATLTTYSDTMCNFLASDTSLDGQTLSSSPCVYVPCDIWFGCGRRYAVGGLGGWPSLDKKSVVVDYEDNRCLLTPVKLTISSTSLCNPRPGYTCETLLAESSSVYQARECISSTDLYVASKFGSTPYLIVEYYANGTNCQAQTNVTMYAADGKCHLSISDGTYFTIIQRSDGAVVSSNYPTPLCKDTDAVSYVLDYWNVNTGTCMGDRIFRTSKMPLATSVSTPATTPSTSSPPSTWTPTPTPVPITEVPVEDDVEARLNIMFPAWLWDPLPPQVFINDGRPRHRSRSQYHRP